MSLSFDFILIFVFIFCTHPCIYNTYTIHIYISLFEQFQIYTKLPFNYSGERQPKWDNGTYLKEYFVDFLFMTLHT